MVYNTGMMDGGMMGYGFGYLGLIYNALFIILLVLAIMWLWQHVNKNKRR